MRNFSTKSFLGLACSASSLAIFAALPTAVSAQDAGEDGEQACEYDEQGNPTGVSVNDPNCEISDIAPEADGTVQENQVVITGSRIVRDDTYSSISPLQVLDTETLQDTGQFDAAAILQQSESAAGTQIDATFQGFVLNNGPNSQTLNLRGLGADRTLLLLNGRRLAPSGVEGAPTSPSINLIPASLVGRYDLLLDGASSVYGSDAVAGVVNVVLRRDLDGLELFAAGELNEQGGGEDYTLSAAWGQNGDNWNFGIGAEYSRRGEILIGDRDFLAGCNTHYEITSTGEIRTIGLADNAQVQAATPGVSVSESACKIEGISGRIFQPFARFGSVYFPANGNIANFPNDPRTGRPFNFGESTNAFGVHLDTNGDGIRDVDFQNVNLNAAEQDISFVSPQDLYNVMAYGEYTFDGDWGITPFFEANYTRGEVTVKNNGHPQLFPSVPDLNIFNPCNFFTNPDGVDCRAVDNELQGLTGTPFALSTGFPLPTTPIFSIRGDRNNVATVQEQYRGVIGLRGDLPFIDFGPGNDWTFELAGVYSRSEGSSVRRGVREDRLALALGLDPTADYDGDGVVDNDGDGIADDYNLGVDVFGIFGNPLFIGECNTAGLANPELAATDLTAGCVPVNLFAPSVLGAPVGDFATQAERDYVFGERTFDTTYEQTLISGFVQGSVFELPGGTAKAVLGGEYRNDTLTSLPDFVASNGLLWGFFADKGAQGGKDTLEAFGEIDLPLMAGETLVKDFRLNLSGRITDDEFYGTNGTYSIKVGWRPFDPLLLKLAYGTSFRAPNLRENFLAGQSGFTGVFDPCAVPDVAYVIPAGSASGEREYNAALDPRDANVLQNCIREGRDPTVVGTDRQNGLNTFQSSSVEVTSGGSLDIDPETSDSFTTGLAYTETFGPIGFDFNFNYYNLTVKGAITEPSAQFIVNDCFTRDDGTRSPFCDRISYDTSDTGRLLVSDVFAGFINLNEERVEGIDINADFDTDVMMFGKDVRLGLNLRANHLINRETLFIGDDGQPLLEQDAGEFGFASWTGRAIFRAAVDNVSFTWQTRYIGSVEQDPDGIDELGDAFGVGPNPDPDNRVFADTCLGAGSGSFDASGNYVPDGIVPGTGVFCRDIGYAGDYFVSNASVRVEFDRFEVRVGVANIFDEKPPLVDSSEVFAISNTPIGNGYDLDGREFFGSVRVRF